MENKLNIMGLKCPEFLMLIRQKLRKLKKGAVLEVITDDSTAPREIPKLCTFLDHTLVESKVEKKPYQFLIKKGLE